MVRPPSLVRVTGRLDGPTTRGPGSYQVLLTTAARGRGHALAGPSFLRWSAGSHLTCPTSTQLWTTPSLVYDHGTTPPGRTATKKVRRVGSRPAPVAARRGTPSARGPYRR